MIDKKEKLLYSGKENLKALGIDNRSDIQPFDEVDHSIEERTLEGHYDKTFARYDLDELKELQNEVLTNPECSYVTYLNDAIKENHAPKFISVLFKYIAEGVFIRDRINREIIGSRLLNLFGLPTVYNFVVENDKKKFVGSVDFISGDQKFQTLKEFGFGDLSTVDAIKDQRIQLREYYKNQFNREGSDVSDEIDELISDYLIHKFSRIAIFQDGDFDSYNGGLLIDANLKKITLAPEFDMEYVLIGYTSRKNCYEEVLNLSRAGVPLFNEKLNKFLSKLESAVVIDPVTQQSSIDKIIESSGLDEKAKNKVNTEINRNIKDFLEFTSSNNIYKGQEL